MIGKAIEHPASAGVTCNDRIVVTLVEIETRLVAVQKINRKGDLADSDNDVGRSFTAQDGCAQIQTFSLANRRIVSLDDRDVAKKIGQSAKNQIFSPVHRQGKRLQDKVPVIAVDNHARETIAFAPTHPP